VTEHKNYRPQPLVILLSSCCHQFFQVPSVRHSGQLRKRHQTRLGQPGPFILLLLLPVFFGSADTHKRYRQQPLPHNPQRIHEEIMASSEKERDAPISPGGINAASTRGSVAMDEAGQAKTMNLIMESARSATAKEQKMTLLHSVKLYPKAIAWSALIATCIVMEGYDISLVNNFC
jgi:hypothetical protein